MINFRPGGPVTIQPGELPVRWEAQVLNEHVRRAVRERDDAATIKAYGMPSTPLFPIILALADICSRKGAVSFRLVVFVISPGGGGDEHSDLGAGGAANYGQNSPYVSVDGPLGDEQPRADLPVGQPTRDQPGDLAFPWCQRKLVATFRFRITARCRPQRCGDLVAATEYTARVPGRFPRHPSSCPAEIRTASRLACICGQGRPPVRSRSVSRIP